jgi:lysophospholipase L1-like esterase
MDSTNMRQSWLKIVLVNLLVLVLILAPLEIATRMLAPEYVNVHFSDTVTRGHEIVRNRTWGHRVTRAQADDALQRTGGEHRVLFVGDSVTFGYGIEFEDTYHEVAGKLLAKADCDVSVHGVGTYFTDLDKLLASPFRPFIVSGYQADLVVYQFNVNDLDVPGPRTGKPPGTRLIDKLQRLRIAYLNQSAFLTAVQSVTMRLYQRSLRQRLTSSLRYAPDTNPAVYLEQWRVMEESLLSARELFRQAGADFAILIVPEAYRLSDGPVDNELHIDTSEIEEWPDQKMRQLAERLGIPVMDSVPALQKFRADNPETRLYFPNDENHPNELGHRIIGMSVADYLTGRLPGGSGGG